MNKHVVFHPLRCFPVVKLYRLSIQFSAILGYNPYRYQVNRIIRPSLYELGINEVPNGSPPRCFLKPYLIEVAPSLDMTS